MHVGDSRCGVDARSFNQHHRSDHRQGFTLERSQQGRGHATKDGPSTECSQGERSQRRPPDLGGQLLLLHLLLQLPRQMATKGPSPYQGTGTSTVYWAFAFFSTVLRFEPPTADTTQSTNVSCAQVVLNYIYTIFLNNHIL